MPATAPLKSTCDDLRDELIKRGMAIAGLAQSEARRASRFYKREVEDRVIALLRERLSRLPLDADGRVKRTPVATMMRQAQISKAVHGILDDAGRKLYSEVAKPRLLDLANRSVRWAAGDFLGRVPLDWEPKAPSPAAIRASVIQTPLDGRTVKRWYGDLAGDLGRRIDAEISRGIANNERPDEILRRIRGTTRKPAGPLAFGRRSVGVVSRSAVQHVHNQALDLVFSRNADVLAGGVWTTLLDLRVCPVCIALAAETAHGRPGFYPSGVGPRPPAHPDCRCFMTPVLLPVDQINPRIMRSGRNRKLSREVLECLAAGLSAEPTIGEWIASRSEEELVTLVGRGKARLLREGRIGAANLIDA